MDHESKSLLMEVKLPHFPPLKENLTTDVCIVGGGIVGLSCAYMLTKQGKSVVVLERGELGGGQTGRAAGHLTWVLDDRYHQMERFFGQERTKLIAESHAAAIDHIEKIVHEENIPCDFERIDGYLFAPPHDPKKYLHIEYESLLKTGREIHLLPNAPLNTFKTGPCIHFPRQAQFHIIKYLNGLVRSIQKNGGKIFTHTHVNHVEDGGPCRIKTCQGFVIESRAVIMATCTPINNRFFIHTKQSPHRSYVIGGSIPKGTVPHGLYWDTASPHHYFKIQKQTRDLDWLVVGGKDHKTGQDPHVEEKYKQLERWTKTRFPQLGKVQYAWSGQIYKTIDFLSFIGRNPHDQNIYLATGDSGIGITHAMIAGLLIPHLIDQKPHPWESLYDPSRKTLAAFPQFVRENCNTLFQYRDWFTPGDEKKIAQLQEGEGIIVRKGLKKIAVYRDEKGKIHLHSARCPHLGGCVRWNPGEKSWDCPCHGSRFSGSGEVLNGPAKDPLRTCLI